MKGVVCVSLGSLGLLLLTGPRAAGENAPRIEPSDSPASKLEYEAPKYLTGTIYAQGGDPQKVLFKFKREATRSGSTLQVNREFTYPDGTLAAREQVVYEGDALASFE